MSAKISLFALLLLAAHALASDPALPDANLTPGDSLPQVTDNDVCAFGFAKAHRPSRTESTALKKLVFKRYGIPWNRHADFELDHEIPLCLGGSNALSNLWPEPFSGPWNAYLKDDLEVWLHDSVCAGTMSLRDAQEQIASNWIDTYKRAFGDPYH